MNRRVLALVALATLFSAPSLHAASLKVSIGLRETNNAGSPAIFSNGGTANGIEFVNQDGQTLVTDGTWQLFTFTPATDTLTAFAGTTANGALDASNGNAVIEHIRLLNSDGVTAPLRVWLDNVTNTVAAGPTVEGFETQALGAEAMIQEPRFSGSTAGFLTLTPNTAAVTNSMAFAGSQSYQFDFQFLNNTPTNWVRLTTNNVAILGNPLVRVLEPGAPAPTVSFYLKAVVIPEPASLGMIGLAALGLLAARRRG